MVKIKTIKRMNLLELIEWAWENDIRDKRFRSDGYGTVRFNEYGRVFVNEMDQNDLLTVEVEEEITEDTVITNLVEVYEYNEIMESVARGECSITNALDEDVDNVSCLAFYMLNDDMTMTLLWKDGGMVE